jgi:hypothetical protein
METFDTFNNNQKINVNVTHESLALQFDSIVFSLKKENDLTDFILLESADNSTKISKENIATHNVFESVTNFAIDSGQMPNKDKIIKQTLVKYSAFDQDLRKTFFSTFVDFPDEYKDGGSNVFRVTKRVKIVLTDSPITRHNAFVESLNT